MAQYYPDFDEMLNTAFCKDSICFRKYAESKKFHHVRTQVIPGKNGFFIEYAEAVKEKDGSINTLLFVMYNKKEGKSIYVQFGTTNLTVFTNLSNKMGERGFSFLKQDAMNDDKGELAMSFYYKKGATGIQTTISMVKTNLGNKELYGFAVKIPVNEKWPKEY